LTKELTLSIDAMGGDSAPQMTVEGVDLALGMLPHVRVRLYGDEAQIAPLITQGSSRLRDRAVVVHTDEIVTNDEKPSIALRSGRNSSMRLAINAVRDGEADGVVSAGNTGALMAMAKFVMRTLPGIDRPAIATVLPTLRGQTVMLDLGANIDCDVDNLVQFAVMGEAFARKVLGLEKPTIGLLNVGVEGLKGNEAVKGASLILQETHLPIEFYGFVEGDDIGLGTVDVVVTDGFTGNVALKTAEGTARLITSLLRKALTSSPIAKLGALLAKPALMGFKEKFDPRVHNGAMFLGLNGICVKSHGGTDAFGFANAIKVAADLVGNNINDEIKHDFAELHAEISAGVDDEDQTPEESPTEVSTDESVTAP
jgi:phosphate acyltransferase